MRQIALGTTLVAGLLAGTLPVAAGDEGHDLGLVTWMGRMQYYVHKLGLSLDAGNRALVGYYVHEVEEVIEEIEKIEDDDGVAVGSLVKKILVPAFEALEGAFDSGDRGRLDAGYDRLIGACNQCHESANRFYLVIERRHDNPYMQRFEPRVFGVETPNQPSSE
jgi:hypothetical protein